MAIATLSDKFAQEADGLPKDAKSKLIKTLRLLTSNPRHPSLQFKKIQGYVRADVYECRVDQFWRLIVRVRDDATFDLIHVGPHDEAIEARIIIAQEMWMDRESIPPWSVWYPIRDYLAGNDMALAFWAWETSDLRQTVDRTPSED